MKQKTEVLLYKAFMDLMRRHPFQKITIQKIASECGVNRQTFYYHFDNIYDLMSKAFEYELVHECRMYDEDSWEGVMKRFLKWMKTNRVIMKNIITNIESRYIRQAIYPLISRSLDEQYMPNVILREDPDMDAEFLHRYFTYGITQYILEWAESDFKEGINAMVKQMVLLLNRAYC
jgi:AcrR family transcriptional regulator